jgi:hypothetical protein
MIASWERKVCVFVGAPEVLTGMQEGKWLEDSSLNGTFV